MSMTNTHIDEGSVRMSAQAGTRADLPIAKLSYIELERVEGVTACWKATTFAGANRTLREWSTTAPANGGYDKVAVRIVWANGLEYSFRLDIKHPSSGEEPDVEKELRHTVDFALGRITNPAWSVRQHARVIARYEQQGLVALARRLAATCHLSDLPRDGAEAPAARESTRRPTGIELVINAARRHGEASDPDHEVGDLQDALRQAWAAMSPGQKLTFLANDEVRERVVSEMAGDSPATEYDEQLDALVAELEEVPLEDGDLHSALLRAFPGFVDNSEVNGGDLVNWLDLAKIRQLAARIGDLRIALARAQAAEANARSLVAALYEALDAAVSAENSNSNEEPHLFLEAREAAERLLGLGRPTSHPVTG